MDQSSIKKLQKVIGYSFSDESLLVNAIRHSSYTNEKNMTKNDCKQKKMPFFDFFSSKNLPTKKNVVPLHRFSKEISLRGVAQSG